MRAISLLSFFKLRNSLRTLFTDPRKLIPALIFLFAIPSYIAFAMISIQRKGTLGPAPDVDVVAIVVGVKVMLILLAVAALDSGLGDGILAFSPSDVDYVFPSPISRRVVLLYRVPSLLFGTLMLSAFVYLVLTFGLLGMQPKFPNTGHVNTSGWLPFLAVCLSVGCYMNLATFFSVQLQDRKWVRRWLYIGILAGLAALAAVGLSHGVEAIDAMFRSFWVRGPFLPAMMAAESILDVSAHHAIGGSIGGLVICFLLSAIPMFLSNANWYEQSIVSTEKMTTLRKAAKGGYSSLMAMKASNTKFKATRPYTVKPFGLGPVALFWAHLCAAAKRPGVNFVSPLIVGIGAGVLSALGNREAEFLGSACLFVVIMYSSLGFLGMAKSATEAANRRKELTAPLPISGWQTVAANLGMPYASMLIFTTTCAASYALSGGQYMGLVCMFVAVVFPLWMAPRMVLECIVAIAYADVADKIQQIMAQMVFWLLASPFLAIEAVLCIPAIIFHSWWLALFAIALFDLPFLALMLLLAGRATERAIATGEPVRVMSLLGS